MLGDRGVKSVDENRKTEALDLLEERQELGRAQVLAIDIRTELNTEQPSCLNVTEFLGRVLGILKRDRAQSEESSGRRVTHADDGLVDMASDFQTVLRGEPVGEQFRHRG